MNSVTNPFFVDGFKVILAKTDIGLIISAEDSQVHTRKLTDQEIKDLTANLYTNTATMYTALLDALQDQYPQIKVIMTKERKMIYSFRTKIGSQERTITFSIQLGLSNGVEKHLELAYVKLGQQAKEIEILKQEKAEVKDRLKNVLEKFNRIEGRLSAVEKKQNEVKENKETQNITVSQSLPKEEEELKAEEEKNVSSFQKVPSSENNNKGVSSSVFAEKNLPKSLKATSAPFTLEKDNKEDSSRVSERKNEDVRKLLRTPSPRGRLEKGDKESSSRALEKKNDGLNRVLRTPSSLRDEQSFLFDCSNLTKGQTSSNVFENYRNGNQKEENLKKMQTEESKPFWNLFNQPPGLMPINSGLFAKQYPKNLNLTLNTSEDWEDIDQSEEEEVPVENLAARKCFQPKNKLSFTADSFSTENGSSTSFQSFLNQNKSQNLFNGSSVQQGSAPGNLFRGNGSFQPVKKTADQNVKQDETDSQGGVPNLFSARSQEKASSSWPTNIEPQSWS